MTMTLEVLAEMAHEVNVANGFLDITPEMWEDQTQVPALLALVHSEISEAWQALEENEDANFIEELADTAIRTVDLVRGMGFDLNRLHARETESVATWQRPGWHSTPRKLMNMHEHASLAVEAFRAHAKCAMGTQLVRVVILAESLAERHGGDLREEMAAKIERNRSRGERHGGKRV